MQLPPDPNKTLRIIHQASKPPAPETGTTFLELTLHDEPRSMIYDVIIVGTPRGLTFTVVGKKKG